MRALFALTRFEAKSYRQDGALLISSFRFASFRTRLIITIIALHRFPVSRCAFIRHALAKAAGRLKSSAPPAPATRLFHRSHRRHPTAIRYFPTSRCAAKSYAITRTMMRRACDSITLQDFARGRAIITYARLILFPRMLSFSIFYIIASPYFAGYPRPRHQLGPILPSIATQRPMVLLFQRSWSSPSADIQFCLLFIAMLFPSPPPPRHATPCSRHHHA